MSYDIRNIKSITDLIRYFSEELDWNINLEDFESIDDITYDFEAEDLGLKEEAFAKISSLKQLRPFTEDQEWGIFCVEFNTEKFEVTALRKILSKLVPNRRNSFDHAVWNQRDLLFLCKWGNDNNSTIGMAHFEEKESGLPQIKIIYCTPAQEDSIQIKQFESRMSKLVWPKDTSDTEAWREMWSSAFTTAYHQVIRDSSTLTTQLAAEAQDIKERILKTLEVESANGYVHLLYDKFKKTLVHDLSEKEFADMYAQTIVYGLFSARCMDQTQESFSVEEAIDCLPITNPFLKDLLEECAGKKFNSGLSFDELEISNVVDILSNTKTDEIIKDFSRQTGGGKEDPVIHFYEQFLTEYDKTQKVQRGVYYTPQPVVNFIVRAVDDILKNEFGLKDGLASTETKKIKVKRESQKKTDGIRKMVEETVEVPAVQILDPAVGTGTFLRQTILQIYDNFKSARKGMSEKQIQAEWNNYVPEHLLPRLNGFEIMMAPYAVSHLKLAMVLKDTGYDFNSDKRLQVYLTNSLEEPGTTEDQFSLFEDDPLAMESVEANKTKKNSGINVVIGNPPYNISSTNTNEWILHLINDYKYGLNERKINLDDDYIKFIRYAQEIIKDKNGILVYISNNSFLDGLTHRRMRESLLNQFSTIYIINLHGNARKKESSPDGSKDENVFDIMQGVSINLFISNDKHKGNSNIYYKDLYGYRDYKFSFLNKKSIESTDFTSLFPDTPNYFFVKKDLSKAKTYDSYISILDLFKLYNSGIQTKRDKLSVTFDEKSIQKVVKDFKELRKDILLKKYELPDDERGWTIENAKEDLLENEVRIIKYNYRPFDVRFTAYTGKSSGFMGRPRDIVMRHFLQSNIGLLTTRNYHSKAFSHIISSKLVSDLHAISDQSYVFPLYVYDDSPLNEIKKNSNLNENAVETLLENTGLHSSNITVETAFGFIYAVLFSKKYRILYNENLRIDFPRIKPPKTMEEFLGLSKLGLNLIRLHTETDTLYSDIRFIGKDCVVRKPVYKDNRVYINDSSYFEGVKDSIWNFEMGTYIVLQHWLKDRKNRLLSEEDINLFGKIVMAISETLDIMNEIDEIIDL